MKKRILALVLAAVLIFSCIGTSVFAGGGEETNSLAEYTDGTGYVAFGDSITKGFVATDNWEKEGYRLDNTPWSNTQFFNNKEYANWEDLQAKLSPEAYKREYEDLWEASYFCRNVYGSYTKQIADELGCYGPDNMTIKDANYWPISYDAMTTDNVLDLLGIDDQFEDDLTKTYGSSQDRFKSLCYYFGGQYSLADKSYFPNDSYPTKLGQVKDARELVNNAKLITLGLGMGDVFNRAQTLAQNHHDLGEEPVECITELVELLYDGYNNFVEQYPLLLQYLKDNSQATVILIGAINPTYGMTLTDETIIPVGNALSAITMLMNQQYKKWAEEYGFTFLDISNVETGAVRDDMDLITFFNLDGTIPQGIPTHPTLEGYTQIKRMVINVLKEKNKEPKENVENIVVDLGRYSNVSYVLVDGILIDPSQYSVENYKLTVKCNNKYAKSLTVAVVDGSKKKTSLMAYQLTYDHGYTAYRCYQTNDVVKTVSKPVSLVKKAGSWFVGLFK